MGCAACTGAKDLPETPFAADTELRPIEKALAGVADEYAECSVCFEPLCNEECSMLFYRKQRCCRHLIHTRCAEQLQDFHLQSFCPECRSPFDALIPLPRLENDDAQTWFNAVDANGDGRLSQTEVLDMLKVQYRLDWRRLASAIEESWNLWDKTESGDLSYDELVAEGGLLQYVTGAEVEELFQAPRSSPPPICQTQEWFRHWDLDRNGSLNRQEVLRAMLKTFGIGAGQRNRLAAMRDTLDIAWQWFDVDGSDSISFGEFIMPNGLGETLRLSFAAEMGSPRPIARLDSPKSSLVCSARIEPFAHTPTEHGLHNNTHACA